MGLIVYFIDKKEAYEEDIYIIKNFIIKITFLLKLIK